MRILALDLSKRSVGWAHWSDDQSRPVSGTWNLGSAMTCEGKTFLNLFVALNELSSLCGEADGRSAFDIVVYEKPLNLGIGSHHTNEETLFTLIGLAATVDLWCEAKCVRKVRNAHQATWRRHFIGKMKRGTKSIDLKAFAMERCRQFGLRPAKHDEAEAIGILSYMCDCEGIRLPWERDEVLRPALTGAR